MRLRILLGLLAALAAQPALAHPHVFVTARAEIVYGPDGRATLVRHAWSFDPGYSAFLTQGLDDNKDGKVTPDELQELAKENIASLGEFDFFTVLKANGAKQEFGAAREPRMSFDDGKATLTFDLPLKTPASSRALAFEVYDPTFFVSFTLAEGDDAVRLAGAPSGCATRIARPKPVDPAQQQKLTESFFEALTASSTFGAGFANRAIIACP